MRTKSINLGSLALGSKWLVNSQEALLPWNIFGYKSEYNLMIIYQCSWNGQCSSKTSKIKQGDRIRDNKTQGDTSIQKHILRQTKRWGSEASNSRWLVLVDHSEKISKDNAQAARQDHEGWRSEHVSQTARGTHCEVKFHHNQEVLSKESIKQATLKINVLKQYSVIIYHEYMGPLSSNFWSSGPGSLDLGWAPSCVCDQLGYWLEAGSLWMVSPRKTKLFSIRLA